MHHSLESYRRITFNEFQQYRNISVPLAKAGFSALNSCQVKCYACNYTLSFEFDDDDNTVKLPSEDVKGLTNNNNNNHYFFMDIHRNAKQEECAFLRNYKSFRSKKFFDLIRNLYFEKERLDTFVEWPITFINPKELAACGFYYLRESDHVACIFCRGIVGSWEIGDEPQTEHKKHFPECKFINGKTLYNVNLSQSVILDNLVRKNEDFPSPGEVEAVAAAGASQIPPADYCRPRHSSAEEEKIPTGLHLYNLPLVPKYTDIDERKKSFSKWSTRIVLKPTAIAEAGFYHCKISDHVQCFYCAGGLKNWEVDDDPWEQHARWYPKCLFVIIKKGIDFVNKIQYTKPRFIQLCNNDIREITTASSGQFHPISNQELKILLRNSPLIKEIIRTNIFSFVLIRKALRNRVTNTGLPFLSENEFYNYAHHLTNEEISEEVKQNIYWDDDDDDQPPPPPPPPSPPPPPPPPPPSSENLCILCYDGKSEIMFYPCHHTNWCTNCIFKLRSTSCPLCNKTIEYISKKPL